MDDYEWAKPFRRRCKARLYQRFHIYNGGRCDLKRDHVGVHVLERGMEIFEFKMVGVCKLSKLAELVVEQEIRKRSE
jgi:hypothetical protein